MRGGSKKYQVAHWPQFLIRVSIIYAGLLLVPICKSGGCSAISIAQTIGAISVNDKSVAKVSQSPFYRAFLLKMRTTTRNQPILSKTVTSALLRGWDL